MLTAPAAAALAQTASPTSGTTAPKPGSTAAAPATGQNARQGRRPARRPRSSPGASREPEAGGQETGRSAEETGRAKNIAAAAAPKKAAEPKKLAAAAAARAAPPSYTITTTRDNVTYHDDAHRYRCRRRRGGDTEGRRSAAPIAARAARRLHRPAPIPARPTAASDAAAPTPQPADSTPAADFVSQFLDTAFRIARDTGTTSLQRRAELADLFAAKLDVGRIAGYTTSDELTEMSPDIQQRFRTILISYLVETYYPRMELASDPSVVVETTPATSLPDGTAVVWTTFTKSGWVSQSVKWHLVPEAGGFKIVDIYSAGASLVQMERDTFLSVMRDGGLPQLMAKLDARTKALATAATE